MGMDDRAWVARFRQARDRAGLSQERLAVEIGVTSTTVSRWERGEAMPTADALKRAADRCGVSLQWIMGPPDAELDAKVAYPELEQFLQTKLGQAASGAEVAYLRGVRWSNGMPTVEDYEAILRRHRKGDEAPEESVRVTRDATRSALARGGKPLKRKG